MNPYPHTPSGMTDLERQLAFAQELQVLSNLIHATQNVDEIMLAACRTFCG